MNYVIEKDCIRLYDADTFDPESTLASGQLFRFGLLDNGDWWVASGDNYATIESVRAGDYIIHSTNPQFFVKYFDLDTDYEAILSRLSSEKVLLPALEYGRGVRLMRQPLCEVILNFIISANNNIPRIRKSVQAICEKFGTQQSWGYAFPTLEQLAHATREDFESFGCGYRASYLVDTIHRLKDEQFVDKLTSAADTATAREMLLGLKGVGPKVADCVLLFGLNRYDVFPVDTWIHKVYREDFGGEENNRKKISSWFVDKFRFDSGYCQQYLFYYKRKDIKLK